MNEASSYVLLLVAVGFVLYLLWRNSSLRKELARFQELALIDTLTGIPNRRGFEERADQVLATLDRHAVTGDTCSTVMVMVDLDKFKSINDTLGHEAGDDALIALAQTLKHRLRASDLFGRLGGDEFAILLTETDTAHAHGVLKDIRSQYETRVDDIYSAYGRVRPPSVTLSFGLAERHPVFHERSKMLAEADRRLYVRKHARDNKTVRRIA